MALYRTKEGDMLDAICLAFYGHSQGYLEAVLDSNPRLADLGPVLPSGIEIVLPAFPTITRSSDQVRLWS